MSALAPVQDIIADIKAGRMVILVDEEDRENEGDVVLAAEFVTPEAINFMVKHCRGLVCLTLTEERCRQLGLEQMVRHNRTPHGTAFTASIEAATGVTTGISAHDRARTIQVAVARNAKPDDIVMPGHIFPLTAQKGGVLIRAGHTEAGCDLAHLAGLEPASVICEILKDDGTMARLPDLITFAQEHGLKIGAIRDLIAWRAATEALVREVSRREVSGAYGRFMLHGFEDTTTGEIHLAMVKGDIDPDVETLVRVHEPISVLDFLDGDSPRHSFSIDRSMQIINDAGRGVIVMLRRTETDADLRRLLDDPGAAPAARWDARTFGVGAQILRSLNVRKMRLLANPRKIPSMAGFDLELAGYLTD
ncbi:bifunctional 3,4-dihydroxy-2-butanone-4-phosphate synthase/GTP cyclohydrolase II [Methyloversatilis sp.]|uniref:bifunctional 3,4-dihydroxy-2-butanone-4-phosphate synthase/GTP cyclohydrolase II n=1 Tax=Methyloversatilis sp. TaxID=2569862 RepID=UPI002736785F|nr:bifunctional 3,4-dihydroxy-2-butanone-4-phosphate synthase/GTP cyclohydrolase II [Methyloversatilis sp.]MDP2870820.1 bifunctional 3,4-dihydroxy-2-butanone-4-phosphate synthase/GTP cyclohydrolase II [Methyloversatilis sp.]MDP3456203.1 bifunctional 3,4-dihydroxy-2-butanone-4-phosphate synthase/GTP cyclohydrolase II [Methyloversatilis sp.]MDP3577155.1 bifunctional 3,4-dihydroxy-2-butanone-4-phosphate synthase/GTP cyclohydrolase II [Methyloversatilis sp.]